MIKIINKTNFKKRKILIILLIAIITISTISIVSAADITINPNTPGGLKKAVETAGNGDTIYLENGVYSGVNNAKINLDKDINLKGKGNNIVLDGRNEYSSYSIFTLKTKDISVSITFENLKITRFYHGITVTNSGTPLSSSYNINNCTFTDIDTTYFSSLNSKITNSIFTKSSQYIENLAGSNLVISNCKFVDNENCMLLRNSGSIIVTNCIFTNSQGIVNTDSGNMTISNCKFKNAKNPCIISNTRNNWKIKGSSSMKIIGSTFENAIVSNSIPYDINGKAIISITSSIFKKTTVENRRGHMTITNSTLKSNKASALVNWGTVTINRSTFTNNHYGAIHNWEGVLKISNTKFKNNIAGKNYRAIINEKPHKYYEEGKLIKAIAKVIKKNVTITPKDGTKVKKKK